MVNQDIIAQDLFYKIRSRFPKMEMGDENGAPTFEATKGRFFDFDAIFEGVNLGTVSISINEPGSLKIYFNRNILEDADHIVSHTWFSFLKEMRKFAMKRLMSFDTRDISKTNLDKRDYGYLAKKESVMNESAYKGTSRTSYKPLQKTRLIIRHSKPVDEGIPGARSRNIESLFIENAQGERFKYPFPHKAGAEAMQRHVANEGLPYDDIGKKIIEMSEQIAQLSGFKRYVTREDLMNNETNHIVDRANQKLLNLKEMISKLSRQHHYEAFKNSFGASTNVDTPLIDDITLEEYKEKFTVKSFKEDIAEVFPLLYTIMQEDNELDLEEVAQTTEQVPELDLGALVAEHPEEMFETWANTIIETKLAPNELDRLKTLVSEHFPVGVNGENVKSTLEELGIAVPEGTIQQLAQLAEQSGPDADAASVVVEFLSKFQPEVYNALNIQSEAVQEGNMAQLTVNGKAVDVNSLEVDGVDSRDYPDFSDAYISYGLFADGTEMSDEELEMFTDEHGDIVHELAYDSLHEGAGGQMAQNFGKAEPTEENMEQTPEEKRHAMEYLQKVARAIKSGEVQPEEVEAEFFDTLPMLGVSDEKTFTAWQRITGETPAPKRSSMSDADIDAELRGVKGGEEDDDSSFLSKLRSQAKSGSIGQDTTGFGSEVDEANDPKSSGMKQVAEFIMGFYDRNTGNFPLGETGVKIKVEKEFGEKAGELAERLIQKLASKGQEHQMFEDMKVLSGQVKRESTLVAVSKKVETRTVNESTDFIDLKKLAGIGAKPKATENSGEVFDLKKLAGL